MAKYKVNVIELLLLNNTVAKFGEIVEDNVLSSDADKLEKVGYIKKATKSDIEKASKKNEVQTPAENKYSKIVKADLESELTEREIDFSEAKTNADLIKLLEDNDQENEK